jgi:hypothetical protein
MIFGERILDYGEKSLYRFKELREKLALPHVGERVRSKVSGTIWKVIEQKEVWLPAAANSGSSQDTLPLQPAIYLRYWRESKSTGVGKGKTLSYHYSQNDPSFQDHWEVLYDW